MHKAYYTLDLAEAVLLKDYLGRKGVPASVENRGVVRIPYEGIASEVWVADEADTDRVRTLIRGFLKERKDTSATAPSSWRCQSCGEENPGEFEFCFSCGRAPTSGGASAA